MTIQYHSGVALAKKKGKDIHIVETPVGVGDILPVVAEGSTVPRMLRQRFADVVNVKDFGAVGDGVTDDTKAFEAAAAKGRVFVPAGSYVVSRLVRGDFCGLSGVSFPKAKIPVSRMDKESFAFRRRPIAALKIYTKDFDAYVQSKILVQALAISDGLAFISFSPDANADEKRHWVGVYDLVSGERKAFFSTGTLNAEYPWNEGLRVYWENGHRYLVCKTFEDGDSTPGLGIYDITTFPANGAAATVVARHPNLNLLSTWCYGDGFYYVKQTTRAGGVARDQILFAKYNESFERVGFIYLAPEDGTRGNATNTDISAKAQSMAFTNGQLILGCGAWYGGGIIDRYAYQGVKFFTPNGVKTQSLLCFPDKAAQLFSSALGVAVSQQENEGLTVADGRLYSLVVINSPNIEGGTAPTFAVVEEQSDCVDAIDFSSAEVADGAVNTDRLSIGVFPLLSSDDKTIANPQTGEVFSTIADVLNYMESSGQRLLSIYLGRASLLDLDGKEFGGYQLIRLTLLSNADVLAEVFNTTTQDYWYQNNSMFRYHYENGAWSKADAGMTKLHALVLDQNTYTGGSFGAVWFPNYARTNLLYALRLATSSASETVGVGGNKIENSPVNVRLGVRSTDSTKYTYVDIRNHSVYPGTDNTLSLGISNLRWSTIYAGTSAISTSDERLKQDIGDIPEEVLKAWGDVKWCQYRFKDAVAQKGDAARYHTGLIAQRIDETFKAHGLDARKYGLLCYDEWTEQVAEVDPKTGEEVEPYRAAGSRWSVRYEEALALECAYQRWRLAQIEARLS